MSEITTNTEPDPSGSASYLEVGRIGKAHGLRGEVVVTWITNLIDDRTRPGSRFRATGGPILGEDWLTIATSRPHQNRWLVRFEGVDDRTTADRLRGITLEAEPIDTEGEVFVHELVDKILVDQHGTVHGPVVALIANPASDLLELGDGRLVPLAFYQSHDDERVQVEVPAGLLDDDA
ncbi:MAG: ribosome maturation factor RimM [Acidimicrobiia bacterium]|nr:ribosome maturation factor RimM [Acidimicrobiia bacterium]